MILYSNNLFFLKINLPTCWTQIKTQFLTKNSLPTCLNIVQYIRFYDTIHVIHISILYDS